MSVRVTRLDSGLQVVTHEMNHLQSGVSRHLGGRGLTRRARAATRDVASARAHGLQGHQDALG